MAKKIKAVVRLQLEAGKASPAPPVGPALASHGVNLMGFCKEYNARTQGRPGDILPADITIFSDGSFTFVLRTSPAAVMLRKAAGLQKGSGQPNKAKVGKVTPAQVREIAEAKMNDLNAINLQGAMRMVEGTARAMGITGEKYINLWEGAPSDPLSPLEATMTQQGKKDLAALATVDRSKAYAPLEALKLAREGSITKFDGTIEVHIRLAVDPRQADQQVRATVLLPRGLGKAVRILVFADGDGARLARDAGADLIADDELIKKIQEGWLEFDVAIATPELMGKVGRLARVLGPRGLMPNPKAGTVAPEQDLPRVINEAKAGRVEFRLDKTANVHVPIGKASFTAEALLENFLALMDAVRRAKPASAKGNYLRRITVAATMGPGVRVDQNAIIVAE